MEQLPTTVGIEDPSLPTIGSTITRKDRVMGMFAGHHLGDALGLLMSSNGTRIQCTLASLRSNLIDSGMLDVSRERTDIYTNL